MTTTTTDRAEINRRNARKSTGPRTPEGKSRSRFNALKHGMAAKTLVLPGEDPEVLNARIEAWKSDLQPGNEVEQYLVERAAVVSWQLDRADRADTARLASIIRDAPAQEELRQQDEALALGRRLFWDRRGQGVLYPHSPLSNQLLAELKPRVSFSGLADDPDDPARLVLRLESTPAGCRWLLDRWSELRDLLEQDLPWQSPDKLKAIRLLGKQPIDAVDVDEVASIFLACGVIDGRDPQKLDSFVELWNELLPGEEDRYKRRMLGRDTTFLTPEGEDEAKALLRGVVEKATTRLEALSAAHRERSNPLEEANRLAFDGGVEGERLRRYQMSCNRALFRTLDTLLKLRRAAGKGSVGSPNPAGTTESETVAETSARIRFAEDNFWAQATPAETHRGDQPEETRNGIRSLTAETAEIAETRIEKSGEETGAFGRTVEIADRNIENNRENEPTTPPSADQNSENEPTGSTIAHQEMRFGPAGSPRSPWGLSTQSLLFSLFFSLVVSAISAISAVKNALRMRLRSAGDLVASAREFCVTGLLWGEKTIIVKHWLDAPARREPNLLMSKIFATP